MDNVNGVKPMLAMPLAKGNIQSWTDWVIEKKYDGIRWVIWVEQHRARAFARPRRRAEGKDMREQEERDGLDGELRKELNKLDDGVYDAEFVNGVTSTDARRKDLRGQGRVVVFDLMQLRGESLCSHVLVERRRVLQAIFHKPVVAGLKRVELAPQLGLQRQRDVTDFVERVWKTGGEGAMVKRKASLYVGKRSTDWLKLKKVRHEVMEVIGWSAGKGEVIDRGPFATTVVRSLDGQRETRVKTLDDDELAEFQKAADLYGTGSANPNLGRHLLIEFNDWTPGNGYRHPMWDRWVEPGEEVK